MGGLAISTLALVTFVVAAATLSVGIIAVVRSTRSLTNWTLMVMAFSFSTWMMSNYYSNDVGLPYATQLFLNRLIFGSSLFATSLLPIFLSLVLDDSRKKLRLTSLLTGILGGIISLSPLVASEIKPMLPVTEVIFAPTAFIYFGIIVLFTVVSLVIVVKGNKKERGLKKSQLQVIGWSTIATLVLAMTSNALLPFVFDSYSGSLYGPLFFFVMIAGFGYAIIKQRLFDVRLVIVRSFVYLIMLILFTIGYALAVHTMKFGSLSLRTVSVNSYQSALLAVVLIFLFQPVKIFLDSIISSLLYRNNYNERKVLDDLSMILINQNDLTEMINKVVELINDQFKPQKIALVICGEKNLDTYCKMGDVRVDLVKKFRLFKSISRMQGDDLLISSESENSNIRKASTLFDAELFIKLRGEDGVQGVLMLGYKGSGKAYSNRDLHLLKVIAREIGLGISNVQKFRKIAAFNETLQHKVLLATEKLHLANAELQNLNKLKDDFISATSHQLRPQLSNARGFTELVLRKVTNKKSLDSENRENLQLALKSIDRMTSIVTGILEANILDKNSIILEKTSFELNYLIKQELKSLKDRITEKDLLIKFEYDTKFHILGDRKKYREAIYNLLDNAVRYTYRGGTVRILLTTKGNKVELLISDDGIGIASQDKKKLFTKNFRAQNAIAMKRDGNGIGLYICKLFIEAHGGSISVSSRLHKGTTFTLILPIK